MAKWMLILILLPLISASQLLSQEVSSSSLVLSPRVGFYASDKAALFNVGGELAGSDESFALGGTVEWVLPGWFGVRASVDRTVGSRLVAERVVGERPCGEGCFSSIIEERPVGEGVAIWLMGLEAAMSPAPAGWAIRPYLVGGLGLKSYRFEDPAGTDTTASDKTDRSWIIGAGGAFSLYGTELAVELRDHWSDRRVVRTSEASGQDFARQVPLHDLVLSLGMRVPLLNR